MIRLLPLLALIAALAGGAPTAQADVTIPFAAMFTAGIDASGATITSLDGFNAGDSITGSVTYDPTALALLTGSTYAEYPVVGATLIDGGTTTTFPATGGSVLILNDRATNYQIEITAYTADASVTLNIALRAIDPADLFSYGLALPSSIPLSNLFAEGYISDIGSESTLGLDFAVPEPASILAFATGLLGIVMIRRRRA